MVKSAVHCVGVHFSAKNGEMTARPSASRYTCFPDGEFTQPAMFCAQASAVTFWRPPDMSGIKAILKLGLTAAAASRRRCGASTTFGSEPPESWRMSTMNPSMPADDACWISFLKLSTWYVEELPGRTGIGRSRRRPP